MKKILLTIAATLALSILTTGCGGNPSDVTSNFLDGMMDCDLDEIKSTMHKIPARKLAQLESYCEAGKPQLDDYEIIDTMEDDKKAVVLATVSMNGKELNCYYLVRNVDGDWKVVSDGDRTKLTSLENSSFNDFR